jgi:hypothetical protein
VEIPSDLDEWKLADDPSFLVLSDETGGINIFRVASVRPLLDGRVAVANDGTKEVLIFDEAGELLHQLGGAGDGPGEFRSISSLLALPSASVGVYDQTHRRFSTFDSSGNLVEEKTIEPGLPGAFSSALHPLSDGHFVFSTSMGFPIDPFQGIVRAESEFLLLDSDMTVLGSYGAFPGNEVFNSDVGAGLLLFGKRTHVETSGDQLIVGTGEAAELRVFSPSRILIKILRWPDTDRSVTPEAIERFIEAGLAEMPEAQHPAARAMAAGIPSAEVQPPFESIIADDEGWLWVGGYRGPEMVIPGRQPPERPWLIFDPEGFLRARVLTPLGFEPYAVEGGRMYGVFLDELGVESVKAYSIIR